MKPRAARLVDYTNSNKHKERTRKIGRRLQGQHGWDPAPRSGSKVRCAKEPESLERLSNSQSALNVRIRTSRTVTDRTRTSLTKEIPSAGYTSYDQGSSLSMDMVMALVVHRLSLPIIVGSIWGPANPPTRCINPSSVHGAPSSTNRRPQRLPGVVRVVTFLHKA